MDTINTQQSFTDTPFTRQVAGAAFDLEGVIRKRYDRLDDRPAYGVFRAAVLIEYNERVESGTYRS